MTIEITSLNMLFKFKFYNIEKENKYFKTQLMGRFIILT